MLRATTACTFSTSQLPKVVRGWCVLYILSWKCASRHNGVHFFISHLASWVRTRRFSEPTFRPSGATNHWKNTVFRDFPTFSRICIFFLLTLSLLTLLTSAFQLSILSEVSLLNFLRQVFHVCQCCTLMFSALPSSIVQVNLTAFENELGVQAPVGFWDPAGFTADGSVEDFKRRRATEIKHGRISMLATMGYITPVTRIC